MSKGTTSQNEVASGSDSTSFDGGSSSPAPTHTNAGGRICRRGRGKESRARDFVSSCVNLVHEKRVRVAYGDDQSCRWFPGAGRFSKERGASSLVIYSIGVYMETIDKKKWPC